jgi:hypothetical protein
MSLRTTFFRGLPVRTGDPRRTKERYHLIGNILISLSNHPGSMQVFILTESIFVYIRKQSPFRVSSIFFDAVCDPYKT